MLNQPYERQAATVDDGHFQVVDLDECVVDSHGVKDAQQMLGRGDQYALLHQACRVAYAGDIPPTGWDREAFEVCANEDKAGGGRGGEDSNIDFDSAVKTYSGGFHGPLNGCLKEHGDGMNTFMIPEYPAFNKEFTISDLQFYCCGDFATVLLETVVQTHLGIKWLA